MNIHGLKNEKRKVSKRLTNLKRKRNFKSRVFQQGTDKLKRLDDEIELKRLNKRKSKK